MTSLQFLTEKKFAASSNPGLSYFPAPTWATVKVRKSPCNQRNELKSPSSTHVNSSVAPAAAFSASNLGGSD